MSQYGPVAPSGDLTLLVAIVVGSLLLVMVAFTLGPSVYLAREADRRASRRDDRRSELLSRLYGSDPDWEPWVAGLDAVDRRVVKSLLRTQLRWVRGTERDRLHDLATTLDVDDWADDQFASKRRHERLQGLTWLALLDRSADAETVAERCRDHPDTRAAGARLLADTDHPEARAVGGDLLLAPGRPLSVLGVDTLARLYEHHPEELATWARRDGRQWDESLFIQVLDVFGECSVVGAAVSLEWVLAGLRSGSPRVREAALDALADYGWRASVRTAVVSDAVAEDPASTVRRAAYRLYGAWATPDALDRLAAAVRTEPDDRARIVAARALQGVDGPAQAPTDEDGATDRVVAWVEASAEVDG